MNSKKPNSPPNSPTPNSYGARDIASQIHPYTNLTSHLESGPLVITSGDGVRVFDEDGKGYIEGMSGLWCTSLGWSEKRLVDAATKSMNKLAFYHNFTGKAPSVTIDLAERLLKLAPAPLNSGGAKVFFANSGSEAVDTAIKFIWYINNTRGIPKKKKIISRIKAYHGVTVAAASLTGLPVCQNDFDLPIDGIIHTDCPHHYRFAHDGESEEDFSTRLANNLEELILKEGPETIAAMFMEPVMGAGGVIIPPKTYFEKIQGVLKKYDILVVADEIICGFGRTGNMWGSETYSIRPDIITMAKALSSAYVPISALIVSEDIFNGLLAGSERNGPLGHGFTYSGHPLGAAVAMETLNIYEERDIVSEVKAKSPIFQDGLRAFASHPLVGEVRGVGMVGAIELVKNKSTKEAFDPKNAVGLHLVAEAQAEGVILRAMGDTVAFSPPLIISEAEMAEMFAYFGRALDKTANWIASEKLN
ncbi:MAG: aminotransferase class III-fold pyridoxal phosphate-dependent enzyme [Rhodospirillaceae bacterium]|nr:aminotransferase class III-fold pyridoxal phosphate-dependent enzyme [Rhodospirillaceae bacterium]